MRIAIEAGTHSPWISRLLERCGHEVLVANARKLKLIYAGGKKPTEPARLDRHLWQFVKASSLFLNPSLFGRRGKLTGPWQNA
ncbi:MAG: hypothetical protein M3R38_01270, partial [Actinomycetota bacterium]|nr:hypothetical protein [Actinomycetota bacterium]